MEKQQVTSSLRAFVEKDLLDGDAQDLDDKTPLLELRLLDSFSIVSLLTYIESEFGVQVPIETLEIERLKDIDTIADMVLETGPAKA